MIAIQFTVAHVPTGVVVHWPAPPRIGERLIFANCNQSFRVRSIGWDQSEPPIFNIDVVAEAEDKSEKILPAAHGR